MVFPSLYMWDSPCQTAKLCDAQAGLASVHVLGSTLKYERPRSHQAACHFRYLLMSLP